jgi:hypothetical protein
MTSLEKNFNYGKNNHNSIISEKSADLSQSSHNSNKIQPLSFDNIFSIELFEYNLSSLILEVGALHKVLKSIRRIKNGFRLRQRIKAEINQIQRDIQGKSNSTDGGVGADGSYKADEALQPTLEDTDCRIPEAPGDFLRLKHKTEFAASAIHSDLQENFITLQTNKEILDYLLIGSLDRTNTGRVAKKWLDKYAGLESGWVVETVGSDFVQFKPDEPRIYFNDQGKATTIKYESPAKYPTDIIRLRHLPHWITGGKAAEEWWNTVVCGYDEGWVTEGAKKAASLLSLGLPAIGLTGIFNTHVGKGREIIPALVEYVKHKKVINLVFDSPDKLSQHPALENAYRRIKNLILEINPSCQVRICCWDWWKGKGVDDAIAAKNLDKDSLLQSALPYYEALMFLNTNIPAYKRITGERYIKPEHVDKFENKYTAMKVGKDGGKTTTAGTYLKSLPSSTPILNPTHRIKLGLELARKLGTQYLNGREKTTDLKNRLTLCINSLSIENVDPSDYIGCVIFLDEVVQFCDFLFSGTLKNAPELLKNLQSLLTNASKIILADADLDYKSLALLDAFMPGCDFLKSIKIYELKKDVEKIPMQVFKVSNRKVGASVYEAAITALLRGEKILVMVDSQRPTSKLGAETLKRALEKGYQEDTGKDIKGLALYAKASKNKGHEASRIVTEGIDVIYEYDFVVYTTVIGTGVSLDKDKSNEQPYFDRVIGGFSGAISINDILQGLHRYRRGVPREVYIPNIGISAPHAGSTYSAKQNKLQTDKIKAEIRGMYTAVAEEIPESDALNLPLLNYHSQLRAFAKYECDNYFRLFCKRAEKDYELIIDGETQNTEIPTVLTETVKQVFNEYAETVVNAKVIEHDVQYEEIKAKDVVLQKEAENLEKTNIAKKYRIEYDEALITEELLILDSQMGYNPGITNHYYLDKLFYAEAKGELNIKRDSLDFDKYRKDPQIKAKLLVELGAQKLIDSVGESLNKFHPIVQEVIANYKRIEALQPGFIHRHLHLNLNEKEPMKMIDSLALKLALTRRSGGRKKLPNGERITHVFYSVADTLRYKLFSVWDENNQVEVIRTQISDISNNESIILEKLRSADTTESEKELLRLKVSESSRANDALGEELQQLMEIREQRRIDFELNRQQAFALAIV